MLYSPDPSWGFRSATQAYYDLFPAFFLRRTDPRCAGAWFVAPPLDALESRYRSFGLGLDMIALGRSSHQNDVQWGTKYLPFDDAHGIASTAYGHHWAFFDRIGASSGQPTYAEAIAHVRSEARASPGSAVDAATRTQAAAALVSTQRDFNGRLLYERYGRFLAYYENLEPMPSLPSDWSRAVQTVQVDRSLAVARSVHGRLDGLHLDSTSGMRRWGAADDYDRRHWAAATEPLTFSYDSGLVVERGIFAMYPHIAAMAAFAHARGMFLSANFNADATRTEGYVGADQIDYFGLEQGLANRAAQSGQTVDAFAMLKRTLADDRPISTLDAAIGQKRLSTAQVDARLQQNLFYGIFAGAWNPKVEADGLATKPRWMSEVNADVWDRYTAIFRELDAAGWRPITEARSSNSALWVERYGSLSAKDLHFTLRNETRTAQRATITIVVRALGGGDVSSVTEEITHARPPVARAPGMVRVVVRLPPKTTRVLAVAA